MNNLDKLIKSSPESGLNCSITDINIKYTGSKYIKSYYIGRDSKKLSYYIIVVKYKTNLLCYLAVLNNEKHIYSIDINSVKLLNNMMEVNAWVEKCKNTFKGGK